MKRSQMPILLITFFLLVKGLSAQEGPQFEGWYTRIVDTKKQLSVAIIGGSFLAKNEIFSPVALLPGYLAIIFNDEKNNKIEIYEEFPHQTKILSDGMPVLGHNQYSGSSTYSWSALGYGEIAHDHIDLEIPGVIEIHSWISSFDAFPGQAYKAHRFLKIKEPIRWYVYSMGSKTNYDIKINRDNTWQLYQGDGYAHQEKNWGMAFPHKWIWMQAISADHTKKLALSGGVVNLLDLIPIKASAVGIKTDKINWYFPPLSLSNRITYKVDPCQKKVKLTARSAKRKLQISAWATSDSFVPVSIPTKKGFQKNGGIESFSAHITVAAFEKNVLQEMIHFENAALEFGGDYMKCATK